MKAMLLAAGVGSRLKPWTDHHPKALAKVNGKSLLQRNVEYLRQFQITDVIVNVHHFASQVIDAIEINQGWGSNIRVSDENREVLETGGGLVHASWYLQHDGPFVLMNADILTDMDLAEMIACHHAHHPLATLATTDRVTSRYFLFDTANNLVGWRNVQTNTERVAHPLNGFEQQKAFSGIHIIEPAMFSLVKRQGKFSMVDVYLDLMTDHQIKSFDHSGSKFIDAGKPENLQQAAGLFI